MRTPEPLSQIRSMTASETSAPRFIETSARRSQFLRYLPLKTGCRFSKKALRASWASSLLKAMRILDSS